MGFSERATPACSHFIFSKTENISLPRKESQQLCRETSKRSAGDRKSSLRGLLNNESWSWYHFLPCFVLVRKAGRLCWCLVENELSSSRCCLFCEKPRSEALWAKISNPMTFLPVHYRMSVGELVLQSQGRIRGFAGRWRSGRRMTLQ